ncbi:MAG: hypothetical protein GQ570_09450 [Helicobacteraceae bacterium]|nr:hypothetical protein [Helicobacteraceae bacterium]
MEPSLNEIDDYNKPLSKKKTKTLIIIFAAIIIAYIGYVSLMENLS